MKIVSFRFNLLLFRFVKKIKKKWGFTILVRGSLKFYKNQKFWRHLFVIQRIHIKLPWNRFQTKFGPDRLSRFDVYWIQTEKQIDKQIIYRLETSNF